MRGVKSKWAFNFTYRTKSLICNVIFISILIKGERAIFFLVKYQEKEKIKGAKKEVERNRKSGKNLCV